MSKARPEHWDTILNPCTRVKGARTFNYHPYEDVKDMLRMTIEQGRWLEAAYYFCEAYQTGPACRLDIIKCLYRWCVTTGIATESPSVILILDDMIDPCMPSNGLNDLRTLLGALDVMTHCLKGNNPTEMTFNEVALPHETLEENMDYCLHSLAMYAGEGRFQEACDIARVIVDHAHTTISEERRKQWANAFKVKSPARKTYTTMQGCFWFPLLEIIRMQNYNEYVAMFVWRLYRIACTRGGSVKFRHDSELLYFWIHALYGMCHQEIITETWYRDGKIVMSEGDLSLDEEYDQLMNDHLRGILKAE